MQGGAVQREVHTSSSNGLSRTEIAISSMHCRPSRRIPGSPPYVSMPRKCRISHDRVGPRLSQAIEHAAARLLRSGALSGALWRAF